MKLFRTTDDENSADDETYDENGDTAMSQEPTTPDDDRQLASTRVMTGSEYASAPTTAAAGTAPAADQPQPTFTPAWESASAASPDSTVTSVQPDPTEYGGDFTRPVSAVAPPAEDETAPAYEPAHAYEEPATAYPADDSAYPDGSAYPADDSVATTATVDEPVAQEPAALPAKEPAAAFTGDEPLLADSAGMRASWQKVQAEFVDDPQAAVMDAADLIEQTAQSLVESLQQRQRQLRATVGGDSAGPGSAAASAPDTEHLRQMMRRYRSLFDQLCNA